MIDYATLMFGGESAPKLPSANKKATPSGGVDYYDLMFGGNASKTTSYAPMVGAVGTAMNFFQKKGYSREVSAGIVGNLSVESGGFDPRVISGKRRGDGGKAMGVAQWHPDRQNIFKQVFGKDMSGSSLEDQLEFVHWELGNNEKKAGESLKKANTPEESASIFDQLYERSSGEHRQRRIKEASKLFGM